MSSPSVMGAHRGSIPPETIGNKHTGKFFTSYAGKYYEGNTVNASKLITRNAYNAGLAEGAPVEPRNAREEINGGGGRGVPPSHVRIRPEPEKEENGGGGRGVRPVEIQNPVTLKYYSTYAGKYYEGKLFKEPGKQISDQEITKNAYNAGLAEGAPAEPESEPEPELEEEHIAKPAAYKRRSRSRRSNRRSSKKSRRNSRR